MLKLLNKWFHFTGCFLLPALLILTGLVSRAQPPDMGQKLTVHYSGVALEKVLTEISNKAHVRFSFSPSLIPVKQKITYTAENKPLEQILNDIFLQCGIQFTLVNGYIVLKTIPDEITNQVPAKPESFTVSGIITDSASHEVLIGAAVYNAATGIGVVSNNYGFFSITLPGGTCKLQTSCMGYGFQTKTIMLTESTRWNIQLSQTPFTFREIIINPINQEQLVFNALAAQTNLDPSVVQRQPAALGETDMLKSLDNLPGVSFQSDGSSYFSVRGGNRDQNLILLDEAPIYNPSHLLGLFTPIIPEAIKHTEIYRADFPVQYGGRLSSVIDIRARDGNMMKFSGCASISPVSTRFSVEGPFKKEMSSYFMAFRISTFGLLVKASNPSVEHFYFADFTSKFNIRLGQRDRIYLTLFASKDAFINKPGDIKNGLEWGNTAATLRWSHVYGHRLFSNTTWYASKYDYSLYTDYDKKLFWNSDITGTNLKSEFAWYITPANNLKFGFNLGGYFFNPGNYHSSNALLDTMRVSQVNSGEIVLYAGDEFEPAKWMKINLGFRLSNWSNYGEAFSISYDSKYIPVSIEKYDKGTRYYTRNYLEPRVSVSFKTGKSASVKVSYNRTIQHINQINNSISPFNSLEVWLPSGSNIKPQYADIYDVGFMKSWSGCAVDLNADIYYKSMHNQLGYSYHAEMLLNPYLEGELRQGEGYAYGFEIMLKKTQGRLTGQIGYASTRSFLHINTLNNDQWYPAHQDKPIDFSLSLDYKVRPRWALNMNVIYTSGMTISSPTAFYYYRGSQVPAYSQQNNDRLPGYKRMDIGSVWRLNKTDRTFEHYLTFTIYNFFNTRNYAFLNFSKIEEEDGKFYIPSDKLSRQEQLTTYRYIYSLIPSFTYSLKF
jgi:hypothetical protein